MAKVKDGVPAVSPGPGSAETALPVNGKPKTGCASYGEISFIATKRNGEHPCELSENKRTLEATTDRGRSMRWAKSEALISRLAGIQCNRPSALCRVNARLGSGAQETIVLVTDPCEMAGALGPLTRSTIDARAAVMALHAACVFPANIKHAFEKARCSYRNLPSSWCVIRASFDLLLTGSSSEWFKIAFQAGLTANSWPFGRSSHITGTGPP